MKDMRGAEISETDLTGARVRRVRLSGARLRMVELTHAVVRDLDLSGTSVDGAEIDGLTINGVEVAPLIEAELVRREPARQLRRSSDPADLREAWRQIEVAWSRTYERVAARPELAGMAVEEEWSLTETLRHLICATDIWLGAELRSEPRYHPWGLPFTGYEEFIPGGADALGLDLDASPSYDDVLRAREERVAAVRAYLADITPGLLAREIESPPWQERPVTVQQALGVVFNEELEHRRFAERDLDVLGSE